jgi:hypothetical protein
MNTGPNCWTFRAANWARASIMRRSPPAPASIHSLPATTIPMLVPDRSAERFGEPTPSTIATVGIELVVVCSFGPQVKTPLLVTAAGLGPPPMRQARVACGIRLPQVHSGLEGRMPDAEVVQTPLDFSSYRWQPRCRGLYQTPTAA